MLKSEYFTSVCIRNDGSSVENVALGVRRK